MTKPGPRDIVSIDAFVSQQGNRVYVKVSRQWYDQNNTKHPGKVRMFRIIHDLPLDDDGMMKTLASGILYCTDPNRRHRKPPPARFWREVGLEVPVPPGGGEGGEDTPAELEMDPLPGLSTDQPESSTIITGPAPVKAARPKAAPIRARSARSRRLKEIDESGETGA